MERSEEIINNWGAQLDAAPEKFTEVSGTLKIMVAGIGEWRFKFGDRPAFLKGDGRADCSLIMTPSVVVKLVDPTVNPQELFLRGDITVSGDERLALFMNQFFGE